MDKENINSAENIENDMFDEQEDLSQDNDNENELIYQYPVDDEKANYESYFLQEYKKNKRSIRLIAYMFFGFIASFMVYSLIPSSKYSFLFLMLSVIILIIAFMFAKGITQKRSLHILGINADEEQVVFTYYTQQKYYKREYIVPYNKIISCRFCNKDYTKIQFVLKGTKCNYYNLDNELSHSDTTTFMVFDINPLSYEQAYFLYVAKQYFNIKGYDLTEKVLKKYGNFEDYLEEIGEGSGEE